MRTYVKELVALQPEVILANTTVVTAAFQRETQTIPIVFSIVADPVGSGFVASLSRPRGNITGLGSVEASFASKWLELLTEIAPNIKRTAIMFNPETAPYIRSTFLPLPAITSTRDAADVMAAVAAAVRHRPRHTE